MSNTIYNEKPPVLPNTDASSNSNSHRHSDEKVAVSNASSSLDINDLPQGEISEKRLLRKLDWHLLPLISIMHLVSFLDRTNFGNAKAAGMEKALHLPLNGFNVAAAAFYVFYCVFEVPSNLLMKKIGPQRWFPFQMVCWGIVCTLISLTKNYAGLIVVRSFLGVTEAGLFPGLAFYISLWYKREELAIRIAVFYASTTASGAFSGIFAYGVMKMEGVGGLHGWRWLFILEGIATVLIGIYAFWGMHGLPATAKFITEQERAQVQRRLTIDQEGLNTHYSIQFVKDAVYDWKSYMLAVIYLGNAIPVYALSLFLPSIIANLGYKNADAQLLSTPPYVLAMFCAFGFAYVSDRYRLRGPIILCSQTIAIIGFAVLRGTVKAKYGFLGTFFTCTGTYSTVPVLISWCSSNTGGHTKKGVRIAMMVGLGNLGGIVSSFVYRNQDRPHYHLGHNVMLGALCMSWIGVWIAIFTFNHLNKQKEEQCKRENITEDRAAEFVNMGDDSPLYRFSL